VTHCSVCERPCEREVEPAVGDCPAVLEPDVWQVVFRNRLVFDACHACWSRWPDEWKHFPDEGFGRSRSRLRVVVGGKGVVLEYELRPPGPDGLQPSPIAIDDLVALLRETAP
jgi:hypothetical protein